MLNIALKYLALGWSVIPVHTIVKGHCTCGDEECPTPGKHPRVRWTDYTSRLPTKRELRAWFDDDPKGSNIGLVTGLISNLVVVDCDGESGARTARKALRLPRQTLVARTGGGGLHYFYKANGLQVPSRIAMLPEVDIKAERGFVVIPPSRHKSGRKYKWLRRMEPVACDLSPLLREEGEALVNESGWYTELLQGVEEGARGHAASKLTGRYFGLGLSTTEVFMLMSAWNDLNSPPLPRKELVTTVKYFQRKHREQDVPQTLTSVSDLMGLIDALGGG